MPFRILWRPGQAIVGIFLLINNVAQVRESRLGL
jgi:hypothetical protein